MDNENNDARRVSAPEETKAERFIRLAEYRMGKTVKDIKQLAQLANNNNYEWTEDQAKKIIRALDAEVQALEEALKGVKLTASTFKF